MKDNNIVKNILNFVQIYNCLLVEQVLKITDLDVQARGIDGFLLPNSLKYLDAIS